MSSLWIRVSYSVLLPLVVALTAAFASRMVVTGSRPPDTPSLTFRQRRSESDTAQQSAAISLATIIGAAGIVLTPTPNYLRLGLTLGAILLLATPRRPLAGQPR